ncbi:hypothetical protein AB0H82_19275 [Streptomyces sp. NPDC050732]|uniref:hypothetical protein n=1 Tax=Streptomyces sp. NPDC050732 TaxID=3154632 RepID=UPI0034284685
MSDTQTQTHGTASGGPSPAVMRDTAPPPRPTSRDAFQRQTIRALIAGTALKLYASEDIDLAGLEVLAKLVDAQTRSQEASLRRAQFYAPKAAH